MTQYPGSLLQADLPVLNTSDMPGGVPLLRLPCHKESCDQLGGALNLPTDETNLHGFVWKYATWLPMGTLKSNDRSFSDKKHHIFGVDPIFRHTYMAGKCMEMIGHVANT